MSFRKSILLQILHHVVHLSRSKDIILNDTLWLGILLQILHHIVLLFFNSQVQTCFACIVLLKPVLTKPWNEILDHIKVAVSSSKV